MKNNKLIITVVSFFICSLSSFGRDVVDVFPDLKLRNELFWAQRDIRPILFDSQVLLELDLWLKQTSTEKYAKECMTVVSELFPMPKIMKALCYTLKNGSYGVTASQVLKVYLLEVLVMFRELSVDPRLSENEKDRYADFVNQFPKLNSSTTLDNMVRCLQDLTTAKKCLLRNSFAIRNQNNELVPIYSHRPMDKIAFHPGHVLSESNWISGNKVSYLYYNDVSLNMHETLFKTKDLVKTLYAKEGRGSLKSFYDVDDKEVFREDEGFLPFEKHPIWTQKTGTFFELATAITSAKESIFMDIFFLGGTTGVALAKKLISMMKENPKLKVMILRDTENHLGYIEEMVPVTNFLRAYSMKHPDQLIISSSYLDDHISGLPTSLASVKADPLLELVGLNGKLPFDSSVKSDHSKVFVIDGLSANPVAFIGSKNLTDGSGAFCYDDVVKVEGPAAVHVLDSYYFDMYFALLKRLSVEFPNYFKILAKAGWAKDSITADMTDKDKIVKMLEPFDVLKRDLSLQPTIKSLYVKEKGDVTVRIGANNVDSSKMTAIDQYIFAIFQAKKNIYIQDQFLFDPKVVLALIEAKRLKPELDIKIIMEPMDLMPLINGEVSVQDNPMKGLPNMLYAKNLMDAGIELRWKLKKDLPPISNEFHMKTLSSDGQFVISGSANKDLITMYGAFREAQFEVFDTAVTKVHDDIFFKRFNSEEETKKVVFDYTVLPKEISSKAEGKITIHNLLDSAQALIEILYEMKQN